MAYFLKESANRPDHHYSCMDYDLPLPPEMFLRRPVLPTEEMGDVGPRRSVQISRRLHEQTSLRSKTKCAHAHTNGMLYGGIILLNMLIAYGFIFLVGRLGVSSSIKTIYHI